MVKASSLRGYVLEEVLAYLIRNSGYQLLVTPSQDPQDLIPWGNEFRLRGRGSIHQIDVLGELKWIPAFTYPLRLIVEAKFKGKESTGIEVVRNAIGVLQDVNQNNSPNKEDEEFHPKYNYVYSVFSTSGFSKDATDMAIAHGISLIDLSGMEYKELRDAISTSVSAVLESLRLHDINTDNLVNNVRNLLRERLDTRPRFEGDTPPLEIPNRDSLIAALNNTIEIAQSYHELFIGMATGPFMLLLKSPNPSKFISYSRAHPSHDVVISWPDSGSREIWTIQPANVPEPDRYSLSFKLPKPLAKWIFDIEEKRKTRAIEVKKRYFSNITIYRYIDERDYVFRLKFNLPATETNTNSRQSRLNR